MANSAEEAKSAVHEFYSNLLELLPIDKLVDRFISRKLLSFDRKSKLDSSASPEEKTRHFLDSILIPGLNVGFTGHFDEMVAMMKESDDVLVKHLAEKLIPRVSATLTTNAADDFDEIEMKIDFSIYEDVSNAFDELFSACQKATKVSNDNFRTIRNSCVARASEPLRGLIKLATDTHCLFEILGGNDKYCNWMDVRLLKVIAIACGNKKLQRLIQNYTDVIYSKPLREVWNNIPHYSSVRDKYYSELTATFGDKDPDNVTVKELIKNKPQLAKEIAILIGVVQENSLVITWLIPTDEVYQAYLSFLTVPQQERKDESIQFGTWMSYFPQDVLLKYEKEIKCGAVSVATLLIGYYHGLLLRDIDADLLIDKMCSTGLLADHEQAIISSGYTVHHRNWLLLEYARHMNLQSALKFTNVVEEKWPKIGSQLNRVLEYRSVSHLQSKPQELSQSSISTAADCQCFMRSAAIKGSLVLTQYLHLLDVLGKLLHSYDYKIIMKKFDSLMASEQSNIMLFSSNQLNGFHRYNNIDVLLKLMCSSTWSNLSILRILTSFCSEAVTLLDNYESNFDPIQPIASYPIPCFSTDMIPGKDSAYTVLAIRYNKELYYCTLQYIYGVQSVMIEKCDITQHCLQLLAVRSDPTIFYWTIPKCVVDLINSNVPLHREYLCSRGILEVLVYPDLLLTTSDDVCCYGSLAFKYGFSKELQEDNLHEMFENVCKENEKLHRKFKEVENENVEFRKQMADQIAKLTSTIDQLKEDSRKLNRYFAKHPETYQTFSKCKVYIPPVIIKDDLTTLEISLCDEKNDDSLSEVNIVVKINFNDENVLNEIKKWNSGMYKVSFRPNKCGNHTISILVNGNHISDSPYKRYVAFRDYSKLTENHYCDEEIPYYEMNKFNRFRDVAIGPDEEIALLVDNQSTDEGDTNKAIVVILDKNLEPISIIGDEKSDNQFDNPEGIAISSSKIVAISDKDQVKKFSMDGRFSSYLERDENCQFRFKGLAFNNNDTLFVADWQNYKIRAYDADDEFAFSFGSKGVGQFQQPVKVATDPISNNVFVCDDIGDGIYVFDEAGHFLSKIICDNLKDITIDPAGYMITGHSGDRNSIRFWAPFYQCISQKHSKQSDRQFESIAAVAVSLTGTLYVVESWKDPNKDILKEILN